MWYRYPLKCALLGRCGPLVAGPFNLYCLYTNPTSRGSLTLTSPLMQLKLQQLAVTEIVTATHLMQLKLQQLAVTEIVTATHLMQLKLQQLAVTEIVTATHLMQLKLQQLAVTEMLNAHTHTHHVNAESPAMPAQCTSQTKDHCSNCDHIVVCYQSRCLHLLVPQSATMTYRPSLSASLSVPVPCSVLYTQQP